MKMNLTNQRLLSISLCLVLGFIGSYEELPSGVEIKKLKSCDPHDETAEIKIYPWPFIPAGALSNISVTFTPAVDVFAATWQCEVITVKDGQTVVRGRGSVCRQYPELCSLPAGETFVWTYSDAMRTFPPGFQMTFRGTCKLFNEEDILLLCWEAVFTIH